MIMLFYLQCFDRKEDSLPISFSLPPISVVKVVQEPYQNGQKRSGSDQSPELSSSSKRTKLHCLEGTKIQMPDEKHTNQALYTVCKLSN